MLMQLISIGCYLFLAMMGLMVVFDFVRSTYQRRQKLHRSLDITVITTFHHGEADLVAGWLLTTVVNKGRSIVTWEELYQIADQGSVVAPGTDIRRGLQWLRVHGFIETTIQHDELMVLCKPALFDHVERRHTFFFAGPADEDDIESTDIMDDNN